MIIRKIKINLTLVAVSVLVFPGCDKLDDDQLPQTEITDFDSESFLSAGSMAIIDVTNGIESNQPVHLNIVTSPNNGRLENLEGALLKYMPNNSFQASSDKKSLLQEPDEPTYIKQQPTAEYHLPVLSASKLPLKGPEIAEFTLPRLKAVTIPLKSRPLQAPAQAEEPIIEKRTKRFELFAMAMPSLFYHNFQTNTSDNLVISSLEERSAISGERLGHKAAVGGTVRYRKNLEFSAGLIYA